jgi:hypothetical protein
MGRVAWIASLAVLQVCSCRDESSAPAPTSVAAAPSATVVETFDCATLGRRIPPSGAGPARVAGYSKACVADSWPEETVRCFATIGSTAEERTCIESLDSARQDWLQLRIGHAESRAPGWACEALEIILREAESCVRVVRVDSNPLPEMRLAMEAALKSLDTDDARTRDSMELRCLSVTRLALAHIREHPCLPARGVVPP